MRHLKKTLKLGRTSSHREALLAGLVCSLVTESRIVTTLRKAKAAQSLSEKMVTLAKRGTLAARRLALSRIRQEAPVSKLFSTVAPSFKDRKGGYTRIMKLGMRRSDSSEMAILEWVDYVPQPKKKKEVKDEAVSGTPEAAAAAKS